jgi:hypothetical protein
MRPRVCIRKPAGASLLVVALLLSGAVLRAQPPERTPIEIRIIEVLHGNGVITDAQKRELVDYAAFLRREEETERAAEGQLDRQVADLATRIEKGEVELGHKAGRGFRMRTANKDFSLEISGRLQTRFTWFGWRENEETNHDNEPDFSVEQARLYFSGNAFGRDFRYELSVDLEGDLATTEVEFLNIVDRFDSENRLVEMKDAWLEFARWREFRVRVGQFRVPYSRQSTTGSGSLQFPDRSVVVRALGPGRDIGVMLHGAALGEDRDLLMYHFGVFDGEGENRRNDDEGLLWVARLALHPFGTFGGESAFGDPDRFRLGLGVNGWLHQDDGHGEAGDEWSVGADVALRWQRFSILAEVHRRHRDTGGARDPTAVGWFLQVGWMVLPKRLEIALRTGHVDWDENGGRNSAAREHLVALNWFLDGHDLKLQTDFGWIEDHEGDHDDNREGWRFRVQMQITF